MTVIVTKEELQEFLNEYDYQEETEVIINNKNDEYKSHLQKFRKYFYAIDNKKLKCTNQNMFQDRVAKQRNLIQKFCNNCSYEFDCAYLAILSQEEHGVWGGLETKKIKSIVKTLRKEKTYEDFTDAKNKQIINLIKKTKLIK